MVQEREEKTLNTGEQLPQLDINEITKLIPHRYPFLLIDRVTDLEIGKSIKGYKNVTANEPFFQGHFPGNPIMPGVLMVEAMAQLGCVMMQHLDEVKGKLMVFAGIDNARFRGLVQPGDKLEMHCELIKWRSPIGKASGKGYVNGKLVVEAEIMFSVTSMSNTLT